MKERIAYAEGYKYQLCADYLVQTGIKGHCVADAFYCLTTDGRLQINRGYAWDGPSGPTFDTKNFMRGSLVHDVLYQMMREEQLPQDCFHAANDELRRICLEDGMSRLRAWWVWRAVERFGTASAAVQPEKITFAP